METTYRGYDIKKGANGYWIYKDVQPCHEAPFATEDAACDEIDKWKRAQAQQGQR